MVLRKIINMTCTAQKGKIEVYVDVLNIESQHLVKFATGAENLVDQVVVQEGLGSKLEEQWFSVVVYQKSLFVPV